MTVQRFAPTRVPLYPVQGTDPQAYIQALHPSLFTQASAFVPAYTGITGVTEILGTFFGTARKMFVAVQIKGPSISTAPATVTVPLSPVMPPQKGSSKWANAPAILNTIFYGPPQIDLGAAAMSSAGVIALPEWNVFDSIIYITGIILEA